MEDRTAGAWKENGDERIAEVGGTTVEETEALGVLAGFAHRKTGAIPPDMLARHILAVTRDADWPVQRAAMEALLRRCSFGKQDALEVASQPSGRSPFGIYSTRRAGSAQRPYTTSLDGIEPLRGSCDCPDFLRNSLGICKHLLAVLDALARRDVGFKKTLAASGSSPQGRGACLTWDPIRNVEMPWNPAVLEQRIGRIYRLGQKRPIDVYNLVTEASIETRIAALVADKKALFTGLFDGGSDEIRFERSGSFLSKLEQIVTPVAVPESTAAADGEDPVAIQAEREVDDLVSTADESRDAAPAATNGCIESTPPDGPPSATEVKRLFSRLDIRPTATGGIIIEAPPEAAASLVALFEGMAHMLRGAAAAHAE